MVANFPFPDNVEFIEQSLRVCENVTTMGGNNGHFWPPSTPVYNECDFQIYCYRGKVIFEDFSYTVDRQLD